MWTEFWHLSWQQSHFQTIVSALFLVYVAFAFPAKLIILIHALTRKAETSLSPKEGHDD